MASVWKHPNSKYWTACYTDHAGRQVKKSTKKTDRDEAMTIALEYERAEKAARNGLLTMAQCQKVLSEILEKTTGQTMQHKSAEQYFEDWLNGKEAASSPNTVLRYRHTVSLFLKHLGSKAKRPLAAISTADVQAFLNERIKKGAAPKTVKVDARSLGNAFNRALLVGATLANPLKGIELPKVISSKRKVFNHMQIGLLVKATEAADWKTAILLGYYTGARLGDCVNMRWENIDLVKGTMSYTPHKTPATEDGEATVVEVPIHPDLAAHLSTLTRGRPEAYLCPSLAGKESGGEHGLSQKFKKIMQAAGIDSEMAKGKGMHRFSKLSFHSLRHSFNSALTNAGVDQETRMKLTGHKSKVVNSGYTHHELEPLKAAISKLPSLAEGKKENTNVADGDPPKTDAGNTGETKRTTIDAIPDVTA